MKKPNRPFRGYQRRFTRDIKTEFHDRRELLGSSSSAGTPSAPISRNTKRQG